MSEKCCKEVCEPTGWHWYPCRNAAKVERDGKWYCGIHDPEAVARRRKKAADKYEAKQRARIEGWERECGVPQLKARIGKLEALLAVLAKSDTESDDAEQWRLDHGLDDTPQGLKLVMQYQNDLQDCIDEGRAILGVVHE